MTTLIDTEAFLRILKNIGMFLLNCISYTMKSIDQSLM